MSTGGDVSEQIVRDGMIVYEEIAKIVGNLAKEAIAFIFALLKKEAAQKGGEKPVTNLKNRALETGQSLEFYQIKKADEAQFLSMVEPFGIQYHPVVIEKDGEELMDIMCLSGDAPAMNRIMEKMGYTVPSRDEGKNGDARATSEQNSGGRGNGYNQPRANSEAPEGKSFMADLNKYKAKAAENNARAKAQAQAVPQAATAKGKATASKSAR